eukprot:sb/3470987/
MVDTPPWDEISLGDNNGLNHAEDGDEDTGRRLHPAVYSNRNVTNSRTMCVTNPLYTEDHHDTPEPEFINPEPKQPPPPRILTFLDKSAGKMMDTKDSDSGSQGSRSSLRKRRKKFKRVCRTMFYIVGHSTTLTGRDVSLYRCEIGLEGVLDLRNSELKVRFKRLDLRFLEIGALRVIFTKRDPEFPGISGQVV